MIVFTVEDRIEPSTTILRSPPQSPADDRDSPGESSPTNILQPKKFDSLSFGVERLLSAKTESGNDFKNSQFNELTIECFKMVDT